MTEHSLCNEFGKSIYAFPYPKTYECCYSCPTVPKRDTWKWIVISKIAERGIEGFVDVDWARSIEDSRSTLGYCTKVWGNVVTWRSKKQFVIAHSSDEAGFRVIAQGICEVIWLERLMKDLHIPLLQQTKVYRDSK